MVGYQTFSNNKNIYSVDMMFAYINIFKPKSIKIPISELLKNLEGKSWGDPEKKIYYSAMDVIKNPKNKKYKDDNNRIKKANLNYPIMIDDKNNIIDGVHRLSKAYSQNKKYIKAYVFDKEIMKKFLVNNNGNWKKIDNMEIYQYIELFHKKFYK